jgi:quinol monooxygenase YgiN
MPVAVLARLSVKPEHTVDFERAFCDYQQQVRALEAGNLFFHLQRARDTVGSYTVMEQYRDDAALAAHRDSEHYRAIPSIFGAFMAGPPDIQVFDSVGS